MQIYSLCPFQIQQSSESTNGMLRNLIRIVRLQYYILTDDLDFPLLSSGCSLTLFPSKPESAFSVGTVLVLYWYSVCLSVHLCVPQL